MGNELISTELITTENIKNTFEILAVNHTGKLSAQSIYEGIYDFNELYVDYGYFEFKPKYKFIINRQQEIFSDTIKPEIFLHSLSYLIRIKEIPKKYIPQVKEIHKFTSRGVQTYRKLFRLIFKEAIISLLVHKEASYVKKFKPLRKYQGTRYWSETKIAEQKRTYEIMTAISNVHCILIAFCEKTEGITFESAVDKLINKTLNNLQKEAIL